MQRIQTSVALLLLLALVLSGCEPSANEDPKVDLPKYFPTTIPPVDEPIRIDIDGNGENEWLIFYKIGSDKGDTEDSLQAAAIYRLALNESDPTPPDLVPTELRLPGQKFLCRYQCKAAMEDVVSDGSDREELVIRDIKKINEQYSETVGVAIFCWKEGQRFSDGDDSGKQLPTNNIVPLGHFRGNSVTVEKDKVTVKYPRDNSNSMVDKKTYEPISGSYYREQEQHSGEASGQLVKHREKEVTFAAGAPGHPNEVTKPEDLVVAFYHNYNNEETAEGFFMPDAWEKIGRDCPKGLCGCSTNREDISRVIVADYTISPTPQGADVAAQVLCFNKGDKPDPIEIVRWTVQRQKKTWDIGTEGLEVSMSFTAIWRLSDAALMASGE